MANETPNFPNWPRPKPAHIKYLFRHLHFFKRRGPSTSAEKRQRIYIDAPMWKSVLIMGWPAILQALLFTSFSFVDTILAVQFAADSYGSVVTVAKTYDKNGIQVDVLDAARQVRIYLSAVSPITTFLNAMAVLFSAGIATRVSVNVGTGNFSRAREILKIGNTFSILIALILIPILMFTVTTWIESQYTYYDRDNSSYVVRVTSNSFNYVVIIVGSFPLQMFWQINSNIFRIDGRNKVALFVAVFPIGINLIFDYIFMGVINMKIEGAAWAFFIAQVVAVALTIGAIATLKSDIIDLKNLFSFKLRWMVLFGVILAGVTPFIRTVSSAATSVLELDVAQTTSEIVSNSPTAIPGSVGAGIGIYNLFFPVVFNLANSVRPIMAYSQAAKLHDRVRSAYYYTAIYGFILGVILYAVCAFGLTTPYMDLWNFSQAGRDRQEFMAKIYLISLPIMSFGLTAITLLGSVERIGLATIASAMRGVILLLPLIFLFQSVAIKNGDSYIYYYSYPVATFISSLALHYMAKHILRTIAVPYPTLNERIDAIAQWFDVRAHHNPFTLVFWDREKRKQHAVYAASIENKKLQEKTSIIEKAKNAARHLTDTALGETAAVVEAEPVTIPDKLWPEINKRTKQKIKAINNQIAKIRLALSDQKMVIKHKKKLKREVKSKDAQK